uniref:Uncharacterized protein n=1 Tax=Arundo donax TaxID=35708 RepID=A0A0A9AGF8_ARUDO
MLVAAYIDEINASPLTFGPV